MTNSRGLASPKWREQLRVGSLELQTTLHSLTDEGRRHSPENCRLQYGKNRCARLRGL
jgi:hypothetical protein